MDIDNELPTIHMRSRTSDKNKATFCTHVNSCAGMNVGNLRLHQFITTTNPDIVEIYIQFNDDNPFDPIRLNCDLGKENNYLKGKINSLVTYKTCRRNDFKTLYSSHSYLENIQQ